MPHLKFELSKETEYYIDNCTPTYCKPLIYQIWNGLFFGVFSTEEQKETFKKVYGI